MTAEQPKTFHLPLQALAGLFIAIAACAFTACSNSESVGNINGGETFSSENAFNVHETAHSATPTSGDSLEQSPSITKYIPLDDTEYPYAGIPRIVIETENRREIKDRGTEIPARLQIWGEKAPESEIMELTIRGRGNTSWTDMPKKSYKIEFTNKQSMLGMPKDRDWALVANYADKTLLKNFITYKLSLWLGAEYIPNCDFIELYINSRYLGVYLITETIKVDKDRVFFPQKKTSFLAEFDVHYKKNDQLIFLEEHQKPVSVHYPKIALPATLKILKEHLDSLYTLIKNNQPDPATLKKWIYLDSYFLFYWVQEFSENRDGNFDTSVFFTWTIGEPLKMGPLWDFDLAYNGHPNVLTQDPEKWFIRNYYWNNHLFKNDAFKYEAYSYWKNHRDIFEKVIDSLYVYSEKITDAAKNNFKRWPILDDTNNKFHVQAYTTQQDAIDSFKNWMTQRINWIDKETK